MPLADGGGLPGRSATDIHPTDANFNDFSILDLNVENLLSYAKNGSVIVAWGDSTIELSLEDSRLWSGEFKAFINDGVQEIPVDIPAPYPFKGHVVGSPESQVRLTVSADESWVRGNIAYGHEYYTIEPRKADKSADGSVEHYVYKRSDITEFEGICGTIEESVEDALEKAPAGPDNAVAILKLKPYGDAEYYNINPADWASRMTAQVNSTEGIYKHDINVEFEIMGMGTYVNAANQPLTSTFPTRLIDQLAGAFQDASGTSRQLVFLHTGKNLGGDTLGVAYQARFGRCLGYALAQQAPTYYLGIILIAHEMGHNFNAAHGRGAIEFSWDPICVWEQYTIMQAPRINPLCMTDHFSPANISFMDIQASYLDYHTPPEVTIWIEDGHPYTQNRNVDVYVDTYSDLLDSFMIGIFNQGDYYEFESCILVSADIPWTLTEGDGLKVVSVRCFDVIDNMTTISDSIILDQTAPSAATGLASSTHTVSQCATDRMVTVEWQAATDATSGVGAYSYSWTKDATGTPDDTGDPFDPSLIITSNALADAQWYFNIKAIDNAGWSGPVASIGPFIIGPAPAAPDSLWCAKDTVELAETFTLEWNAVVGTESYKLFEDGVLAYEGTQTDFSLSCDEEREYVYDLYTCNNCGCNDTTVQFTVIAVLPSAVEDIDHPSLPTELTLQQNFPNPFNPTTRIEFALPRASFVTLDVYNIIGRQIRTLVNQRLTAGYKAVTWNGRDNSGNQVSSGMYLYRLRTDFGIETRKMLLLK